jgi:hypothetical protein
MTLPTATQSADTTAPVADRPSTAASPVTGDVLRVERGAAEPEELAAVTAVLLARAAAQPPAMAGDGARPKARWRRLERERGFHAPHSWRV